MLLECRISSQKIRPENSFLQPYGRTSVFSAALWAAPLTFTTLNRKAHTYCCAAEGRTKKDSSKSVLDYTVPGITILTTVIRLISNHPEVQAALFRALI